MFANLAYADCIYVLPARYNFSQPELDASNAFFSPFCDGDTQMFDAAAENIKQRAKMPKKIRRINDNDIIPFV